MKVGGYEDDELAREVMAILQRVLTTPGSHWSRFPLQFIHAGEAVRKSPGEFGDLSLVLDSSKVPGENTEHAPNNAGTRTYNAASSGVACLFKSGDALSNNESQVVVRPRSGGFQQVSTLHSAYGPLAWPLLGGRLAYHKELGCTMQQYFR